MPRRSSIVFAVLALAAAPARATRCPNLLFVLDQSGSMGQDPMGGNGSPSKWALATTAIQTVINQYAYRIPLGLELFTSSAADDAGCYADTRINVQPAHGTAAAILSILAASSPLSGTNTGEAIQRAATDAPALHDPSRRQYLVLITDGDPNCNSGDQAGTATFTTAAIAAAAAQTPSIHTIVVGFDGSGGVDPNNLNRMARAGLEPIPGCQGTAASPCYYSASNDQTFLAAIDQIVGNLIIGGTMAGCDDSCLAPDNACAPGEACLFQQETDTACVSEGCYATPCPSGQVCRLVGQQPACTADLCATMSCPSGTYCAAGACEPVCPPCAAGQRCSTGTCVPDFCAAVKCAMGQTCDPASGDCVEDRCLGRMPICLPGTSCDPTTGQCVDAPCRLVHCPDGSTCSGGSCELASASPPDLSATVTDAGAPAPADLASPLPPPTPQSTPTPTCTTAGPGSGPHAPPLALALLLTTLLAALTRRR